MIVPVYDFATFATYLRDEVLQDVADFLLWDDLTETGPYRRAILDTLLTFGVDDPAEVEDTLSLRAVGRYFVWVSVADATAHYHTMDADGARLALEGIHAQAADRVKEAAANPLVRAVFRLATDAATAGTRGGHSVAVPVEAEW
jgi:hypothetical protein